MIGGSADVVAVLDEVVVGEGADAVGEDIIDVNVASGPDFRDMESEVPGGVSLQEGSEVLGLLGEIFVGGVEVADHEEEGTFLSEGVILAQVDGGAVDFGFRGKEYVGGIIDIW